MHPSPSNFFTDEVRMDFLPSPMMDASPSVSNAQLKSNDNDSDIHQENVNEIAKMSNQEILEKQKELLTLLGKSVFLS